MTRFLTVVSLFLILSFLTACGGGGGGGDGSTLPIPTETVPTVPSLATVPDGKAKLLGVTKTVNTSSSTITPEKWLDFVEVWSKNQEKVMFPSGAATQSVTIDGISFVYRYYAATKSYLAVRSDGRVYALSEFTGWEFQNFGQLADYVCDVYPEQCGGGTAAATDAGTIVISDEGHLITPKYVNNKLTYLGADGKGWEIAASDVAMVCFRSDRLSNWGKQGGVGCAARLSDGTLHIPASVGGTAWVANNDCGQWTLYTQSGQELWFDFKSTRGWKVSGDSAKLNAACGVEYGKNGRTQATVSATRSGNTATLTLDFGSNYLGGFFGNGAPVSLDPQQPILFVWNGAHAGAGGDNGWGVKTEYPSVKWAFLTFDNATGRYLVTFTGLACADHGNVTVYTGSGSGSSVSWNAGKDGFGLGWLAISKDHPLWSAGAGIAWDYDQSQLVYDVKC